MLHDAARLFTWNHDNLANPDAPAERWRFQPSYPVYPTAVYLSTVAQVGADFGDGPPAVDRTIAADLRSYQLSIGFTPGPVMAAFLLLGLVGVCWRGRSRGAPARAPALLYLLGTVAVLGAADFYEFTWRYQLPGLVLAPAAGVLGLAALIWRPAPAPFPTGDDGRRWTSMRPTRRSRCHRWRCSSPPTTRNGAWVVLDAIPRRRR